VADLGQVAYTAYAASLAADLPGWADLAPAAQAHWVSAAGAVAAVVRAEVTGG
jgi:uncharacterized membrane protein